MPAELCNVMDEHLDMAAAGVSDTSLAPRDGTAEPAERELAARALHNRRPPYLATGIRGRSTRRRAAAARPM